MPTLYMLIGVPAAGKSTWIKNQNFDWAHTVVASTDDQIERIAAMVGKTYNDVFGDAIKPATAAMNQIVHEALQVGADIVWDQTNTSVKGRAPKLAMFPESYTKIAVFFPTPSGVELTRRLATRPGKTIPDYIVRNMIRGLAMPTHAEGFDYIRVI